MQNDNLEFLKRTSQHNDGRAEDTLAEAGEVKPPAQYDRHIDIQRPRNLPGAEL